MDSVLSFGLYVGSGHQVCIVIALLMEPDAYS